MLRMRFKKRIRHRFDLRPAFEIARNGKGARKVHRHADMQGPEPAEDESGHKRIGYCTKLERFSLDNSIDIVFFAHNNACHYIAMTA